MGAKIPWDEYEAAMLMDTYLKVTSGALKRSDAVANLSTLLRSYGKSKYGEIDSVYRNYNGISMQMSHIEHLCDGRSNGIIHTSKLFERTVALYKNNPNEFNKLLTEAKNIMAPKPITEAPNTESNKFLFLEWLNEQRNVAYGPTKIVALVDDLFSYAKDHGIYEGSLWEISTEEEFLFYCEKILTSKTLRISYGARLLADFNRSCDYYKKFLSNKASLQCEMSKSEENEKETFQINFASLKPLEGAEPISLAYFEETTIESSSWVKLYLGCLKLLYEDYPETIAKQRGMVAKGEGKPVIVSASNSFIMKTPVEFVPGLCAETAFSADVLMENLSRILDECSVDYENVVITYKYTPPHSESVPKAAMEDAYTPVVAEANTNYVPLNGIEQLNLYNVGNLSFTKPVSFVYKGNEYSNFTSWCDLYAGLASLLRVDFPSIVVDGMALTGSYATEVSSNVSKLRSPKPIGNRLYIETNHSSTEIALRINMILAKCGISPSGVVIKYTRGKVGQTSAKAKAEDGNTELSIANAHPTQKLSEVLQTKPAPKASQSRKAQIHDAIVKVLSQSNEPLSVNEIYNRISKENLYSFKAENPVSVVKLIVVALYNGGSQEAKVREFGVVGNGVMKKYYLLAPNKAKTSESKAPSFSRENYVKVLSNRYQNGLTFDSIDFDIFRDVYESLFNKKINVPDPTLENQLRQCGVFYKGRLYPAEGIIDPQTRKKLFSYIENCFSRGNDVLYYKAIMEDLADDFSSCYNLADENMLSEYIAFEAPKGKYFFSKEYMSAKKYVKANNASEVEECLRNAGRPMSLGEIDSALFHIPQDKIEKILKSSPVIVRNAKGEYFHSEIFEASPQELDEISQIIKLSIDENEYAVWSDVWNKILENMPNFVEMNCYLSPLGIRERLSELFRGRFNFNGAIISPLGKNYSMGDIFLLYAKHHSSFSLQDIDSFAKELDTHIYFDSLRVSSFRVSHDLFVPKSEISFDVEAVDLAISSFISGDFLRLREIDSFLSFPNVGYEWNEYLLESYLAGKSKMFMLLNNGFAQHNVAGFVAKRRGGITEFVDAVSYFLAASRGVELKKDPALDYLMQMNVISRKSYKEIDLALRQAAQIRARKE